MGKKKNEIIRTSRHYLDSTNSAKRNIIVSFLDNYQRSVQNTIDLLWDNPYKYEYTKKNKIESKTLDIKNNIFDCPSHIDYKLIQSNTNLSARALCSATNQACGIVKSKTIGPKKLQFTIDKIKEKLQEKPDDESLKRILKKTERKLEKVLKNLAKPNVLEGTITNVKFRKKKGIKKTKKIVQKNSFSAELSSKNAIVEEVGIEKISKKKARNARHFEYWITLQCLGSNYEKIEIPIKMHRQARLWERRGFALMGSILLSKSYIELRWAKTIPLQNGKEIGCDTGVRACATFSNQTDDDEIRINGWTYEETIKNIEKKRKGSKNFKKADSLRKQTLNGTLNFLRDQRNLLDGVGTIYLENNSSLKYKNRTSRYLARHTWGDIRRKISSISEESGVRVLLSWSGYKSQRCSACGWTQEANRPKKGILFKCKACGFSENADKNASRNAMVRLPWIDFNLFRGEKRNKVGFFWNPDGIVFLDTELGVPNTI